MKRIIYTLALIAVAATACQKEDFKPEDLGKRTVDTVEADTIVRYMYTAPSNPNYRYERGTKDCNAFVHITDEDMIKLNQMNDYEAQDCVFVHQYIFTCIGDNASLEDNGWFVKSTFVKKALLEYYDMFHRTDEDKNRFAATISRGEFLLGLLDGEYSISVEGYHIGDDWRNLVVIDAGTGWDYTETNFVVERVYIKKL